MNHMLLCESLINADLSSTDGAGGYGSAYSMPEHHEPMSGVLTQTNNLLDEHMYHQTAATTDWRHCNECHTVIAEPTVARLTSSHSTPLYYHDACLRCCVCAMTLTDKCYEKYGRTYCDDHYYRLVAPSRCTGCGEGVGPTHLVYRVLPPHHAPQLYHYECHACHVCGRALTSGDSMAVDEAGIMCVNHAAGADDDVEGAAVNHVGESPVETVHERRVMGIASDNIASRSLESMSSAVANIEATVGQPVAVARSKRHSDHGGRRRSARRLPSSSTQASTTAANLEPQMCRDTNSGRTYLESPPPEAYYFSSLDDTSASGLLKRRGPRTTIKQGQLDVLNYTFETTPKPSKHARAKLALQTGLSMRVIQVWFQNRRSKERRLKHLVNWIHEHESRGMVPPISMAAVGLDLASFVDDQQASTSARVQNEELEALLAATEHSNEELASDSNDEG